MTIRRFAYVLALLSMMAASMASGLPQSEHPAVPFERLTEVIVRNCAGCHFTGASASKVIALDNLTTSPAHSLKEETAWRKVYSRAVSSRSMPPPGSGRSLNDDDRSVIRDWIDGTFPPPGSMRPTLRRLTNYEYNRSIRDLFGFDFDVESYFQKDNANEGFTNSTAVMFASAERTRQYFAASQFVAQTALGVNDALAFQRRDWGAHSILEENPNRGKWTAFGRWVQDRLSRAKRVEPLPSLDLTTIRDRTGNRISAVELSNSSSFAIRHEFPVSGVYRITLRGVADDYIESATLAVAINGIAVPTAVQLSPHRGGVRPYTLTPWVPRGKRSVQVSVRSQERALLSSIEIEGPVLERTSSQLPAFLLRLPCTDPEKAGLPPRNCADLTVRHLATRAFRIGSLEQSDVEALLAPFEASLSAGANFPDALSLSLQAILLDPRFVYRFESPASSTVVDDFEFATRLSYFLWASLPDDELRRLAAQRSLVNSPDTIRPQVTRMLADPRADAMVDAFADGWLGFSSLKRHVVDTRTFPEFDEELRQAMLVETTTFLKDFLSENRPIGDLIASKTLYINGRLARHYGIDSISGSQFLRIESPSNQRGGLLTQGSILTVTSSSYRTSVVKRGFWILDRVLCETVEQPPPNVPMLEESSATGLTLRQEMERHRADPLCATCHSRMDPPGFSLENYDATGGWRTHQDNLPIDASGEFLQVGGTTSFKDFAQLRDNLKNDPRIAGCMTKKLMTYALGRNPTDQDTEVINAITTKTQANGNRIQDTIAEIVLSEPFRKRLQ